MKTKLLKFLIGTAVILPLAGTVVLAETETDSAGNTDMKDSVCCLNSVMPDVEWNGGSEKNDEQMPVSVSGTDGVYWFITSRNVLVFEAGELNRDDSWKNFSSCIREIRVVPNEKFDKLILPEDSTKLFSGLCSLTYIDSSRFDTSRVTGMNSMFADCCSLESLDLSGFDTRNVSVFREMFCN